MAETKRKVRYSAAWQEAQQLIARHRYRMFFGLFLLLIGRAANFALPYASKVLLDDVVPHHDTARLASIAWLVVGATLVQAACSFTLAQILGIAAQRAINDLRATVQAHVTRLPISYFDSTQSGALISRIMTDADGVRNLVGNGIVELIGGLITASVALAILFYKNTNLTLLILGILSVFGVCMARFFRYVRPIFRERSKINAEVTGRLGESLGGIRIVKAYVAEPREQKVFATNVSRIFDNVRRSITATSGITAVITVVVGVVSAVVIVVGGGAIITNRMTIGDFTLYVACTGLVAAPLIQIASIGTQITEALAGLDRIHEIREMATEDALDESLQPCADITGDIAFENVSFEYNEGKPVLRGVSFQAPAGSTTALVGSSGSGKSTLVSLVMAFNRPKSGVVKVDGRDLTQLRLKDYRSHLGVVMQDNFLFDGTIAENISFSRPDATQEQIRAVSRVAHCEEFILNFEKGYDTVVGERGVKLSGGQRQRIGIARALLADPTILILDEATSSLDSESEALIQDGLRSLRRGRTTFVIAHRMSTIRSADQILVVEAGQVIERGNHEQLMAADGRYRELYDRQYHFERERFINPGEDFTPEPVKVAAGNGDRGLPPP